MLWLVLAAQEVNLDLLRVARHHTVCTGTIAHVTHALSSLCCCNCVMTTHRPTHRHKQSPAHSISVHTDCTHLTLLGLDGHSTDPGPSQHLHSPHTNMLAAQLLPVHSQ